MMFMRICNHRQQAAAAAGGGGDGGAAAASMVCEGKQHCAVHEHVHVLDCRPKATSSTV